MMKPDVIASEITVFNREHLYAGTLDLLAVMPDGKRYVIDWKTAKAAWPEYSLQIEAYRMADGAVVPGDPPTVEKWDGPIADAGAVAALKACRDGVAVFLLLDDRDDRVTWHVAQERAPKGRETVRVVVRARDHRDVAYSVALAAVLGVP